MKTLDALFDNDDDDHDDNDDVYYDDDDDDDNDDDNVSSKAATEKMRSRCRGGINAIISRLQRNQVYGECVFYLLLSLFWTSKLGQKGSYKIISVVLNFS